MFVLTAERSRSSIKGELIEDEVLIGFGSWKTFPSVASMTYI